MNPAFVAVLEKMHQALAHLQDVIPAAAGMKGVLASIRADLDAMVPPDEKAPEPEAEDAPKADEAHQMKLVKDEPAPPPKDKPKAK